MAEDKRIAAINKAKEEGLKRHAQEYLMIRESKMRRFCNFWLILFNVRNLKPFSQLIKTEEMKELKMRVTLRLQELVRLKELESLNDKGVKSSMSRHSVHSTSTKHRNLIEHPL